MIRLSVLYPSAEGASFDHDYYRDTHVPAAVEAWRPVATEIDRGVGGPYVAAVHFMFASQADLDAALAAEGTAAIQADVANYTSITPVLQISEIVSGR
jgi:uncharacterized protein (TIGR02118 family)